MAKVRKVLPNQQVRRTMAAEAVTVEPVSFCLNSLLTAKTTLKAIKGVRIWFTYRLYNLQNELINEAETELAFVDRNTWKPCSAPDFVLKAIDKNTNNDFKLKKNLRQQV